MIREIRNKAWSSCALGFAIIMLVLFAALIAELPSSQPKPTGLHYPKTFHFIPCGSACNK